MPSAAFFAHLGFFVRTGVLSPEDCEELVAEACRSPRANPADAWVQLLRWFGSYVNDQGVRDWRVMSALKRELEP